MSTGTRVSELPPMLSAPLPSPTGDNADVWNMDDDDQSKRGPRERADQPE